MCHVQEYFACDIDIKHFVNQFPIKKSIGQDMNLGAICTPVIQ